MLINATNPWTKQFLSRAEETKLAKILVNTVKAEWGESRKKVYVINKTNVRMFMSVNQLTGSHQQEVLYSALVLTVCTCCMMQAVVQCTKR